MGVFLKKSGVKRRKKPGRATGLPFSIRLANGPELSGTLRGLRGFANASGIAFSTP